MKMIFDGLIFRRREEKKFLHNFFFDSPHSGEINKFIDIAY